MRKTILTVFGIFCLIVGVVFLLFNYVMFPKKYSDFVFEYSKEYDLDQALVFSIIKYPYHLQYIIFLLSKKKV